MPDQLPDTKVPDTQEDFENSSQLNAAEASDSQGVRNLNRKRTYDVYQDLDTGLARKLDSAFATHFANVVDTGNKLSNALLTHIANVNAQTVKHADVAMDGLWTDELNPVARGAGGAMWGQAPVNSQLASTASIDAVFGNITAQYGELVTQVVGLSKSVMANQQQTTATLAEVVAVLKGCYKPPAA